jgi:hypothetical protein
VSYKNDGFNHRGILEKEGMNVNGNQIYFIIHHSPIGGIFFVAPLLLFPLVYVTVLFT